MKIFIAGDVINQYSNSCFIDESLISIISRSDYSICNFEGVIESHNQKKHGMLQKKCTPRLLKEAGFNLCLLANNHITDYGFEGLKITIQELGYVGLDCIGAGLSYEMAYKPKIINLEDSRVAILNICEAQPGYLKKGRDDYGFAWMGDPSIEIQISDLSAKYEYTIIVCHAGFEHYNLPLPFFRERYRAFCDAGASCIVAMHPHITQGIEEYDGKPIFYSLGNFYFPRQKESDSSDIENQSFSIILNLEGGNIKYDLIFHKMDNLVVRKCEGTELNFSIEELCNALLEPTYENIIRKQIPNIYHKSVEPHFLYVFNGTKYNDSIVVKFKKILKYLFSNSSYQSRMKGSFEQILRMTENESYRSIIETAMRCLLNKKL